MRPSERAGGGTAGWHVRACGMSSGHSRRGRSAAGARRAGRSRTDPGGDQNGSHVRPRGEAPPDPARPHQVSLNFVEDYSAQRFLLALHAHALPLVGRLRGARLMDLAVGYKTRGSGPSPSQPARRTRRLFVGVSLNVQRVLDLALAGHGGAAGIARRAGHLTFELVNPRVRPRGSVANSPMRTRSRPGS
jgi:hypothetical protein